MTPYTGKTPLKDALAELCGYSPKSHNKLTQLVNDALHGLGKTSKAKNKGVELNLAIYQWHVDRLHSVNNISQLTDSQIVETFSQPINNDSVNIISQPVINDTVKHISQSDSCKVVKHISLTDSIDIVNIFSQQRIAFYTIDKGIRKRQVIALDGFYVNALMLVAGIDKRGVTAWVQSAVDGFTGFDCNKGITKQVKYLVIDELTKRLSRDGIVKSELSTRA